MAGHLATTPDDHRIPGREAIPAAAAGAPERAAVPSEGMGIPPRRPFPFPFGSLGFPASPRLPPARKSPPGVPRRKVALSAGRDEPMRGCPRNDPPGTRASLSKAPERPACPWGDTRTRKRRLGGGNHSPRPVATGPSRPPSRETPPEAGVAPDARPFIRPAEAGLNVQPPDPNPDQLKKPGGASPLGLGYGPGTPMNRVNDHPARRISQVKIQVKLIFLVHKIVKYSQRAHSFSTILSTRR